MALVPRRSNPRVFEGAVCAFFAVVGLTFATKTFYYTAVVLPKIPNLEMGIIAGLLGGVISFIFFFGLGLTFLFTAIRLVFGGRWSAAVGLALLSMFVLWLALGDTRKDRLIVAAVELAVAAVCIAGIDALVVQRAPK